MKTNTESNSIVEKTQRENDALKQEVSELKNKLKWYEEQFRLAQQKRFGKSSDQFDPRQLSFFNEPEQESKPELEEPTIEEATKKRQKKVGTREEQLKDLPIEVIEYRLNEEEQICPCCSGHLHEMSSDVSQEVKVIPAKLVVVKHVRYTYACRNCDKTGTSTPVITAVRPKPPIKNSIASPSIMAFIMSQKYSEAMPLYRQSEYLSSLGFTVSRQTLSNWMLLGAEWLRSIYNRLHEELLKSSILHADETVVQVLREEERQASSQSYMWLYQTGHEEPNSIVLYDYQTTRASKYPAKFLKGFSGYLHTDGYSGYKVLSGIKHAGCWVHARRYFAEVIKITPKEELKGSYAAIGVNFCDKLFRIEREIAKESPEKRFEIRQERSKVVLDAFLRWLRENKASVTPKSLLGKAFTYCLNQWSTLITFLDDGRLELSNNRAERSIKPFVIGRKNWLFSNTPKGATASSMIYSIVLTAKQNGIVPYNYLTYLFEQLPNVNRDNPQEIEALLPWSSSLPADCFHSKKDV